MNQNKSIFQLNSSLNHFFSGLYFILILCLISAASQTAAQSDVAFTARASSATVSINDNIQVFFTLENATAENFTAPQFRNFEILSGPNYSSNVQFANGKVFKREEYSFILRPLKTGTFRIGPATVKTENRTLKSNELTIKVVNAKKNLRKDSAELFVKIEPSEDTVYLGQQLTINYKVYTKVNVERYSFEKEPLYDGFYAEELDRFFAPTNTEIINGESYTSKIIRRLALFPLRTGTHRIEEAAINFIVSESSGFLFRRNVKNIKRATEPIDISVLPLPQGAPPTFSGAVGQFTFEASLETTTLKVGEGTALKYVITGNGDPKRVQPPSIASNDTFEIYKPTIINEKIDGRSKEMFVQQIQVEYQLIPKTPGNFFLKPEFSYFDPDSNKYVVLKNDPIEITVLPSSVYPPSNISNKKKDSLATILPIKRIEDLKTKSQPFFNSFAFWTLLLLPVLLFSVYLLIPGKSANSSQNPENIQDLLNSVKTLPSATGTDLDEGFSKLSEIFRKYLILKFALPKGFSRQNLESALLENNVEQSLRTEIISLLNQVELGTYSPLKTIEEYQQLASKVADAMHNMENEINE